MKRFLFLSLLCLSFSLKAQIFDTVYTPTPYSFPFVYKQEMDSVIALSVGSKVISPQRYFAAFNVKQLDFTLVGFHGGTGGRAIVLDSFLFNFGDEYNSYLFNYTDPYNIQYQKSLGFASTDYFKMGHDIVARVLIDGNYASYYYTKLDSAFNPTDTLFYFDPSLAPPTLYDVERVKGADKHVFVFHYYNLSPHRSWSIIKEWVNDSTFVNVTLLDTIFSANRFDFLKNNNRYYYTQQVSSNDFYLICLDSNFSQLYQLNFITNSCQDGSSFTYNVDKHDNVVVAQTEFVTNNSSTNRTMISRFDNAGVLSWQHCIGPRNMPAGAKSAILSEIVPLGDTAYAFIGRNNYQNNDKQAIRILIIDTAGNSQGQSFSVLELPGRENLSTYPNPAVDYLQVALNERVLNVHVLNYLGQPLMVSFQQSAHEVKVDVSRLPAGVYYIQLETENGLLYYSQFIKAGD